MRPWETDREYFEDYPGRILIADWMPSERPVERYTVLGARKRYMTRDIEDLSMEWGAPIRKINSVVWEAAILGLRMVRKGGRVLLLGCESRWPPQGDPRMNLHHHYLDHSLPKSHRPFPVSVGFDRQWVNLVRFANTHNRGLYTCSPWEDLRHPEIPYLDFAEACR